MQSKEVVNVSHFVTEWSKCLTGRYQRDRLYRFGKFDDCGRQWRDVRTALSAKLTKDEAKAKEMIEGTFYRKSTTVSPTAGVIWELKENPGWD
jgi:hypothetical protein